MNPSKTAEYNDLVAYLSRDHADLVNAILDSDNWTTNTNRLNVTKVAKALGTKPATIMTRLKRIRHLLD